MKKNVSYLILILFLGDILYLSYQLPQIVIKGQEIPDDIQNWMIGAAVCIMLLFLLKEKAEDSEPSDETNNTEEMD